MAETIHVEGYRELVFALGRVNKGAKTALLKGLRDAADPIAQDARSRLGGYQGIKTSSIRPRAGLGGVYITQGASKVTGKRGDFGALQMREGLLPAAYSRQDDIADKVEDAITSLALLAGF